MQKPLQARPNPAGEAEHNVSARWKKGSRLNSPLHTARCLDSQDRWIAESRQRTRARFEKSRLPRWTAVALANLICTSLLHYFEPAAEAFESNCPAHIEGARRERLKALNIWISIAYYWASLCPARNAPVWLFLYEVLKACGAPLPATYEASERARQRVMAEVRAVIEGKSRLSQARRFSLLTSYPCVLGVMR
jgi:hypothetical protein